jgi:hypothetical protein
MVYSRRLFSNGSGDRCFHNDLAEHGICDIAFLMGVVMQRYDLGCARQLSSAEVDGRT